MRRKLTIKIMTVFFLAVIFPAGDAGALDSLKVKNVRRQKSIGENIPNDAGIFAKDAAAYFTLPLHMSGDAWLWAAG